MDLPKHERIKKNNDFWKKFRKNACKIKIFMYNKIEVSDGAQDKDPIFTVHKVMKLILPQSRRIKERIVR